MNDAAQLFFVPKPHQHDIMWLLSVSGIRTPGL